MSSATVEAAIPLELVVKPVTATTLSCEMTFVMAFADSEGSPLLSASTVLICLPNTPPLALISLNASLAPLFAELPKRCRVAGQFIDNAYFDLIIVVLGTASPAILPLKKRLQARWPI